MYHATEYVILGLVICIGSLGVGLFSESALWGYSSAAFLFTLLGIWVYVRESDI